MDVRLPAPSRSITSNTNSPDITNSPPRPFHFGVQSTAPNLPRIRFCQPRPIPPEPAERITHTILVLRGQRVLLDTELAALYDVSTKRFNEQIRRNRERFPEDFMFQLTAEELAALRSQIATLKGGRGQHRKYLVSGVIREHGERSNCSVSASMNTRTFCGR